MERGRWIFIILKAFTWGTDLWVTLGDFAVKNAKFGRGICIQLKIDLLETKWGARWLIAIICVTYVQKGFQIRTSIKQLLTKYQFSRNCPKIQNFKSIIEMFETNSFYLINPIWQGHVRNLLFPFCQLWAAKCSHGVIYKSAALLNIIRKNQQVTWLVSCNETQHQTTTHALCIF